MLIHSFPYALEIIGHSSTHSFLNLFNGQVIGVNSIAFTLI